MDHKLNREFNQQMAQELVQKTRKQIQRNYREAFGSGIIWAVVVTWLAMAMTYALGNTPNPGIMIGTLLAGLWYRYGGEKN